MYNFSLIWHTCFDRNESDSNRRLKPMLTENVASRSHAGPENLDEPSTSQPEMVRNDPLDTTYGLQYNSPSESSYAISSCTQPNATTYTYPQGNTQMQSLSHLSSLMVIFCPIFCPFSTIV